ncbi:aminotransferase class III [Paenibacillus sp. FSL R7-0273]|uniref:aspartate aminotransferase family protein n=1 Tax=Paenibacillus sp. FSL R7-0273 TaxID=1536772 RepID=UPI0004F7B157|nr:aspartate aminotransferase family protein [Paenibacillus sp. FSL R7-0273]AIQ44849.1 aminotransferase class III [Paenibacillus sp. FSL R7-0273]OMF93458.1 aspartate aminotransferase family protein [Paenibacillus sp. FSL R7-0273]
MESTSFIGREAVAAKRKQYFYPCTAHFYRNAPQIVRGSMQYVYDENGKEYTDFFAGVSVVACGHCNPAITDRTIAQLQQLQHTSTVYLTQPNVDLAERLAAVLPGNLRRSFFVNSGSEANEGALLLARMHTGRKGFIALESGLHGRTNLTMSVTGLQMWRTDNYLDEDVTFIERPYHPELTLEKAAERSVESLKRVLEAKGDTIAAMIVEPIQGNGGMIMPAPSYFRKVKALLEQYGVLLIDDEIQTGYGRTGAMFAIEHFGVVPDIISMAKALGNGVPVAAFATTDEIAASLNRPSASTFGGNPVSAATALAVLDYIEAGQLPARAAELGGRLKAGLEQLRESFPALITDVRGTGFMLGAELAGNAAVSAAELTDDVLEELKDRGYLIGKNGIGRNVLAFQPPLIVTAENIDGLLNVLGEALLVASQRLSAATQA